MNVQLAVFDILGNSVMNLSSEVTSGDNLIPINVQALPSGIYVVDITNGKSHYTEKFIVE